MKNPTGSSAQNEPKVEQGPKAGESVLTGSKQLSSAGPRLCTQPWTAICPKLLLEYVIIPIAAKIFPKFLEKQISDTVRSAIEMINQLESGAPTNFSGDLRAAYLHNLIEDLNVYTSGPLLKDTAESFISKILNQKFGSAPNEKFEENESTKRIKIIGEFKVKVGELKKSVGYEDSKEEGCFFDSVFQSLRELDAEAKNSIHCNDALSQKKD
ncbi:hypothetical protein [Noviherbaspirillum soli]|uniref:hypothetical protein n=1 Tax=Noviherbaspirillum soli TaxID=1064518 RepID=UPI00188A9D77|nr:hypothetical protein [Noviherbaspirillum soli]